MIDISQDFIDDHGINLKNLHLFIQDINRTTSSSYRVSLNNSDFSYHTESTESDLVNYSVVGYTDLLASTQPLLISIGGNSRFYTSAPIALESDLLTYCEANFLNDVLLVQEQQVPSKVTRRQARQQLLILGLLDDVEAQIALIPDETQRRLVEIFWQDSNEFERDNVQLNMLAASIGLTQEQLDQAFIAAKLL